MKSRWICIFCLLATGFVLVLGSVPAREFLQTFSGDQQNPTLVIDAGHGGFDGGAVGFSGVTEQDINLHIARNVYDLAQMFGHSVRLTREDEQALDYVEGRSVRENKVADIHARERIVRETENPVFISIHLNKFEDPKYFGAQVFYSKNHADGQNLAEQMQNYLVSGIANHNIRRAKPAANTIYLMKQLACPAIIVECGFLSNPQEEQALCDPEYQKRLAVCIWSGYQSYINGAKYETKNTISLQ